MRLIDADELINDYISESASNDSEIITRRDVNNAPTVEAEPVRHGHWIEHEWAEEENDMLVSKYECSCCHDWNREASHFCPTCGAKMDEEEK